MPNLTSFIDTSDYYHPDLRIYYDFKEIQIDEENFKLLHFEGEQNGEDIQLYILTDNDKNDLSLLRLVKVIFHNKEYFQIQKSYSVIPQKGYGEKLYDLCSNFHSGNLISDQMNTLPGSYNLWKKILRKKNSALRFDIKNNRRFKIDLDDEFSIWGVPQNFLEVIQETPWEAVIFEEDYEDSDDYDEYFIDYLSENDKLERTILSDFIVRALKSKKKIKDRSDIVILI